jgi:flagellar basal-body rod protein FlgB
MDPTSIPLFALADKRLSRIGERQSLLARNIANADTPDFKPRDLKPFITTLNSQMIEPARTSAMHLAGSVLPLDTEAAQTERAPDGNGVAMDEELTKIADTDAAHRLVEGLYRKYLGLFRTVLGR